MQSGKSIALAMAMSFGLATEPFAGVCPKIKVAMRFNGHP